MFVATLVEYFWYLSNILMFCPTFMCLYSLSGALYSFCFPKDKPSKLNVPMLSHISAHQLHVHTSWPVGQLKNRLTLCSTKELESRDLQSFVCRARSQHISPRALATLVDLGIPRHGIGLVSGRQAEYAQEQRARRQNDVWCVLPHAPALSRAGIGARVNRYLESELATQMLSLGFGHSSPHVRIGWKNHIASISRHMCNSSKCFC